MSNDDRFHVARTLLAELPCPVVIIAAAANGERSCATGTAMYVSFVPPLFAIAVHPGSHTAKLIEASGEFSISLLSEDEVEHMKRDLSSILDYVEELARRDLGFAGRSDRVLIERSSVRR